MQSPSTTRRRVLAVCATLLPLLAGCVSESGRSDDPAVENWHPEEGSWPLRWHDPRNTSVNPTASPPSDGVSVLRSVETEIRHRDVLVADGYVLAYGNGVRLLERGSDEPVWTLDEYAHAAAFGPPDDDGRMLYLTTESDGTLAVTALALGDDGPDERFRTPVEGDTVASILPTADAVFVGTGGTDLPVLDPSTGDRLATLAGRHAGIRDGRLATTTYGKVRSYTSSADGTLLDEDAEPEWTVGRSATPPELRGRPFQPAMGDGRTLVGSFGIPGEDDGHLHCFDAETGEPAWEPRSFGWATWTPAIDGDVGYVCGSAGRLAAVDLADGSTLWHREVDWQPVEPVVGGDVVLLRHDDDPGYVEAFAAESGQSLWGREFDGYVSAVRPVGERVYAIEGETVRVLG